MRYFASFVAIFAWALWLGGMVALVLFVQTLFAGNRVIALDAAPMLFVAFGRVQLLLGACALIATFAWWMLSRRKSVMALFVLFAISAALAAGSTTLVTNPMERLRSKGLRESPRFKQLHRWSTSLYMGEMLLLLSAGAIIPGACANVTRPSPKPAPPPSAETAPDTAAA